MVDISKTVHFAFGAPLRIVGRGSEEHEAIIHFISAHLTEWGGMVK
jgi:1-acyl-sn-glycerol-3-phosphate acyltransferase